MVDSMYIKAIQLILPVLYRKLDRGEVTELELERAVAANRTKRSRTRYAPFFVASKKKVKRGEKSAMYP